MTNIKNETNYKPVVFYDYIPWGMSPTYDIDGAVGIWEVFQDGKWLSADSFMSPSRDRLILNWIKSDDPEEISRFCQSAIDVKSSTEINSEMYGTVFIGFQNSHSEYRVIIIFNSDPTFVEDFSSSTPPEWLKIK